MNIVVNHASDNVEADRTVEAIRRRGRRAVAVQADVADHFAMTAVFDAAENEFGGVDFVVNTAGIMIPGTIASFDLADLDRMYRTNIRGAFIVFQLAANRIRGGGNIISLLRSVGRSVSPAYETYATCKGAVEALTLTLSRAMSGRNVSVNSVAFGPAPSGPGPEAAAERIAQLAGFSAIKRLGDPEDIAEIVSFLAGAGRWITGQNIFVNSGEPRRD
jgi:3-oxoacyl-[acyl-carrier protein] reductase